MVEQISVAQLSQLLTRQPPMRSVPDRLAEFTGSPDPIYVICEAGMRSQQVAPLLESTRSTRSPQSTSPAVRNVASRWLPAVEGNAAALS